MYEIAEPVLPCIVYVEKSRHYMSSFVASAGHITSGYLPTPLVF